MYLLHLVAKSWTTRAAAIAALLVALAAPAYAQTDLPPRMGTEINLSGPRFGVTLLSQGNVDALRNRGFTVRPLISQFGWQFERRLYTNTDGVTTLFEWIPLISGLDQGLTLPSLNWLVGMRSGTGMEFGIGPNISAAGVGLVIAAGATVRSGALNIPLNFAFVSSKSGPRVTLMTGFNFRK